MLFRIILLLALTGAPVCSMAQLSNETAPRDVTPKYFQELAEKQFGPGYKLDEKFDQFRADFDGDGHEDLALVLTTKDPLGNSAKFEYKVVDPYDSYFGFGDPKITSRFANFGDGTSHCIAVIHDWKAEKPKAKFMIVNFPFKTLTVAYNTFKNKSVAAFYGHEIGGLNGIVFWGGKKYRWEPSEFSESDDMAK